MNYYLIITNIIDYEWDIENKFECAGFPIRHMNTIKDMQIGDKIIYYVTKYSKFMAAVEVNGSYYFSEKQIWDDPYDLWPCRIKTKPLNYISDVNNGVYIKDIWDNLDFIKNKIKWGSQVQGSFRKLNEHDYNVIYSYIKEHTKKGEN